MSTAERGRKVFRDYDQAELDRQYDQRAWASNAIEVIQRYTLDSDRARERLGEPQVFAYGPSAAEALDLYRTGAANAPIHVFVHGGAWRSLSKRDSAFAAESFVRAGAHFIALDFALLPVVSLGEMVVQVRRSLAWIYRNAARFQGDPERIHLCGHSSGAHLAACAAVTEWESDFGVPQDIVKTVLLVSGIYDLLPVRLSARNDYVQLDSAAEEALSPIRHLDRLSARLVVACGEKESDEFKRQSRDLATATGPSGVAAPLLEYAELNHFEVALTLAQAGAGLGQLALELMRSAP